MLLNTWGEREMCDTLIEMENLLEDKLNVKNVIKCTKTCSEHIENL